MSDDERRELIEALADAHAALGAVYEDIGRAAHEFKSSGLGMLAHGTTAFRHRLLRMRGEIAEFIGVQKSVQSEQIAIRDDVPNISLAVRTSKDGGAK